MLIVRLFLGLSIVNCSFYRFLYVKSTCVHKAETLQVVRCLNKLSQENSGLSKLSSFMVVCLCFVSTNSSNVCLKLRERLTRETG